MHVRAALQAFLLQLAADGRSPHTIGQYRRHATALADWLATNGGTTDVDAITPDHVAAFFADAATRTSCRGGAKKATSLNAMRTSIRCFLRHLHDAGLVPTNPARMLRRARCAPPPPRALHDDEQRRLLDVLATAEGPDGARDRMLIELLLGTGIRIGSAIALDVEDIDFDHGEITLRTTKNDRPAVVILPRQLAAKLRAWLDARSLGPLFLANGRRISVRHAQRRIAGWLGRARISGRSAHSLRHSYATELLARVGDLRLVQAAMCHASIVSTTIYAHIDRARLREAVQA
ncbi:MAG: tyrosine-type recombinase/integrase [Planctomycetes bacterium]|nr:tyrosine-type recombinase/integrase [Planctomycetota bacterium]